MALSFLKKITKTANTISRVASVTNSLRNQNFGTAASDAIGIATGNRNIANQINSISGFSGNLSSVSQAAGRINSVFGSQGQDFTGGTFGAPSNFNFGTILGGATELEGLVNNPIRLINRGASEMFGLEGGRFDVLRQAAEDLSQLSQFDQFIDDTFTDPRDPTQNSGNSKSRIPNPLREYSSYNYKFTLGILSSKEFNNPNLYREGGGFKKYIIKSTGGSLNKRYQVLDEFERSPQGHGEYFLEDFSHEAVVSPNPATGVTQGMTIQFKVIEPFSMGNFTEAIVGASASLGYKNYFSAPFCIRIDFTGWKEDAETQPEKLKPVYLPLKINKMDMRVTGQGCEYDVTAVPYTDLGLADNINKIMTNIKTPGNIVHEILQTGENSLTASMNRRIEGLEESNVIPGYDRYVIAFPKNRESILKYLSTGLQKPEAPSSVQTVITNKGIASKEEIDQFNSGADITEDFDLLFNQEEVTKNKVIKPVTDMFETLLAYASDVSNMNEIGISGLVSDDNEGGDTPMATYNGSYSDFGGEPERAQLIRKDAAVAQQPTKGRLRQFKQGDSITGAIEEVLLNSEYCKENAVKESDSKGVKRWFRIDTNVYLSEDKKTEEKVGRPPAVFVYSVFPYETDEAKTLGTGQIPKNTKGLKQAAAKEYNYLYTGNNEDVLRFDIEFNTAFMKTALAGYGNNSGGMQAETSQSKTNSDAVDKGAELNTDVTGNTGDKEAAASTQEVTNNGTNNVSRTLDIRRQVAEQFHKSITNQISDMLSVEMDIWGDPFFLPQEIGNYAPKQTGSSPNATEDGTMTYTKGEVFIVVNFRTPFDYSDGALMEQPMIVPQFSGLFSVVKVTNNFVKGQYTQTLKLIRRYGQSQKSTTGNVGLFKTSSDPKLKPPAPTSGAVQDSQKNPTGSSQAQKSVNQADNLLTQAQNSGRSSVSSTGAAGSPSSLANAINVVSSQSSIAQAAVSKLTNTGNVASQALSKATANQAVNTFGKFGTQKISISQQNFDVVGDVNSLINDALSVAVPSFGKLKVDLESPAGKLGAQTAAINDVYNAALGANQPPAIADATDLLKTASFSVDDLNLAPVQKVREDAENTLKNQSTLRRAGRNLANGTIT